MQQIKEMILWLLSNPHRVGNHSFIANWLKRHKSSIPKPSSQPSQSQEEQPQEVDPDLAELMKERDERIRKQMSERENKSHE